MEELRIRGTDSFGYTRQRPLVLVDDVRIDTNKEEWGAMEGVGCCYFSGGAGRPSLGPQPRGDRPRRGPQGAGRGGAGGPAPCRPLEGRRTAIEIENRGLEAAVSGWLIDRPALRWNLILAYEWNRNRIADPGPDATDDSLPVYRLGDDGTWDFVEWRHTRRSGGFHAASYLRSTSNRRSAPAVEPSGPVAVSSRV